MCQVSVTRYRNAGNEDPWVRAWWARRLKRQVPCLEYYSVSPAGHVVHDECPETINQLLAKWIAQKVRPTPLSIDVYWILHNYKQHFSSVFELLQQMGFFARLPVFSVFCSVT
jgi:hypothetical protein